MKWAEAEVTCLTEGGASDMLDVRNLVPLLESRQTGCLRGNVSKARAGWLAVIALGLAALSGRCGLADEVVTDANIVTGLDISASIEPDDMRRAIEGLAGAIRSPEVLRAIEAGAHRRIGFAVFAWHYHLFPEIVAWTVIGSEADAAAVSRKIVERLQIDVEKEAREQAIYIGRLTDISQAIDHATGMLDAAPFPTSRAIVNIIGNGEDNVGEDASFARDRFVAAGGTVNGVVLGGDESMMGYYQGHVIGGPGAFVMSAGRAASLAPVLARKFLHDIVAGQ